MATSSITKEFILRDAATCERLAKVLNQPSRRKKKPSSHKYEEGKKLLTQLYSH